MAHKEGDNPATASYWDRWYEEGPGIKRYEWYNVDVEDLDVPMRKHLKSGLSILQVGVGNSLLLEEVIESQDLKDISLENIDISEVNFLFAQHSTDTHFRPPSNR